MMHFEQHAPWLAAIWQRLLAAEQKPAHALLFAGMHGLGKRLLAEDFAARVLCAAPLADGGSCRQCTACKLFAAGSHPDFFCLEPAAAKAAARAGSEEGGQKGGRQITIEQVRALQQALANTGHQSQRRAVLIDPLEAMNGYTANALLKLLEEPPAGCRFLLVSAAPARLLPTIRSRCQIWHIQVPSAQQAQAALADEAARSLLALCGGAPLAARRQAARGWAALRNRFVGDLAQLPADGVLALASRWDQWLRSRALTDTGFGIADLVDWLQRWVSDVAAVRLGGEVRSFPDAHAQIAQIAQRTSVQAALSCYNDFLAIRRAAHHPLNARLMVEDMLLRYAALLP